MSWGRPSCSITPWFMTAIVSAIAMASSWSWVTYTVVACSRSCNARSSPHITCRNSASSAPSGSSIMNACGWRTMARPSATRWRSPLDSPATGRSSRCVMRRMRAASATRVATSAPGTPLRLQRERDVRAHVHVRVQREQLEHEGDVALRRALHRHVLAPEMDAALRRQLEAGDHAHGRRLAAARGPEQAEELAVAYREARIAHGDELAEALLQVLDSDIGHGIASRVLSRESATTT